MENERLAKLETELIAIREEQVASGKILADIRAELTRYKGFFGGMLFVVSALITLVTLFGKKIGLG